MEEKVITKGNRIRWRIQRVYLPCLSGAQFKMGVDVSDHSGIVRHVRGDHPVKPTKTVLYVDPDKMEMELFPRLMDVGCSCGRKHVEVQLSEIIEVCDDTR